MENLLSYLDESLLPLEEQVKQYLAAEREVRLLETELVQLQHEDNNPKADSQTSSGTDHQQTLQEKQQQLEKLLQEYEKRRSELIAMLPERNKYTEINLGYGPSVVGYFDVDPDTRTPLEEPVLRVVH